MTNYENSSNYDDDKPILQMDERVVWISDNGPEYGNVRWLGKLPDLGKEWMAGVEFDNPVGSGTGLYKDRQLFVTPLNHASLVPVIGLLKASDFGGPPAPEPPIRSSSVKLIDFDRDLEAGYPYRSSSNDERFNYNKHQPDNARSRFHNTFESYYDDKTKISTHVPEAQMGRVRHIPITIEKSSNDQQIQSSRTNNFRSDQSVSDNFRHEQDIKKSNQKPMQDLVATMKLASVSDFQQVEKTTSPLPAPSLIVASGDKSPAITLKDMLGKSRGIQGHNNTCYLDSTLFAMFATTSLFDSLLIRTPNYNDIPEYNEIQRILRENIVKPLRKDYLVSADQVMSFRTMLERSSSVEGLTDEEKDPEEFLSLLLGQILKAEPYLKLSSGLESFFYQLIVDKDENVILPTVQDLFDQSFVSSTVRLREIPPCLLLQMPRFGRQYKMYSRIMPSLTLDITDVLESAPRACGFRGKDCDNIARYECKDCMRERSGHHARLSNITYCANCFQSKHFGKSHVTGIEDHDKTKTPLDMTPKEAILRYSNKISQVKDREIPRVCMDLFAVLCIETSHYVCFVKCGQETNSPWCFFDSMADRRGEQNGYNIPEVLLFEEFAFWTSDNGTNYLLNHRDDKLLPDLAKRLVCDAYLCFYRHNGLSTYR